MKTFNNIPALLSQNEIDIKPTHCVITEVLTKELKTRKTITFFNKADLWGNAESSYDQAQIIHSFINEEQIEKVEKEHSLGHKITVHSISDIGLKAIMHYESQTYNCLVTEN